MRVCLADKALPHCSHSVLNHHHLLAGILKYPTNWPPSFSPSLCHDLDCVKHSSQRDPVKLWVRSHITALLWSLQLHLVLLQVWAKISVGFSLGFLFHLVSYHSPPCSYHFSHCWHLCRATVLPNTLLPQGLCTYCFICLECSSSWKPQGFLPSYFCPNVFRQWSLCWSSYIK